MGGREVLREVMTESKVSQSELSRMSGVRQPSISQFLSGRIEMSDEMLDRLLSCLGYRLEVVRRPVSNARHQPLLLRGAPPAADLGDERRRGDVPDPRAEAP